MRTTLCAAEAASPRASKAERVWPHDRCRKCAFRSFFVEENKRAYVTLFRSSSREVHPNKEEKHWLHCKPLNLKTINLRSHLYLCLYFRLFWLSCIVLLLLYLIFVVVCECNSDCSHYFHISHWQKNACVLLHSDPLTHCTAAVFDFRLNYITRIMTHFICQAKLKLCLLIFIVCSETSDFVSCLVNIIRFSCWNNFFFFNPVESHESRAFHQFELTYYFGENKRNLN